MGEAPQRTTLVGIQYLRALAALLVLVAHARNPRPWLFNPLTGWDFTAGVEIFFVISGVIMYAAARDDAPIEFMRRRIIRVAPLYWLATLSFVAWLALRDLHLPSARELVLSLLMVPHHSETYRGHIWPVLVPGWTLNYEMFFYGVFAVGLAVRRVAAFSMGVLILAVVAGYVFSPQGAVLKTYTSPILLAFLGGLAIAWARERLTGFHRAWPLAIAGALALGAHFTPWVLLPKLAVILASAALVAGVMALEPRLRTRPVRPFLTLADASYAIYLFHTLVLALVYWRGRPIPLDGWPQFLVLMALGVGLSISAGIAIHRWLERPLLKALNRLGRPSLPPVSPTSTEAASQART
jgi:exopolysaccharide production protein ExoZ